MADAYDGWNDSEDENEEGTTDEQKPPLFKASYLLIAIDTDKSMFEQYSSGRSPFMYCLEACYKMANSLLITTRGLAKGPFAIVLAENKLTKANFVDFDHLIPDTIKLLKSLTELSNAELKAKYLRTEDFELADFFLLCKNKLSAIKADVYKRNIVYLTNDDNPAQNDAKLKFKIINESQKFLNLQIYLNVFTFKYDFDSNLVYSEILNACKGVSIQVIHDTAQFTEDLIKFVKHKYRKYRGKLYPFKGNTELYIEIVHIKFIESKSISKNMHVTRDTQKEVKKSLKNRRKYITDYQYCYTKSDSLTFSSAEKEKFNETDLPLGYTLICVGEETYREGWILEPNEVIEKHYQETELIFESFWQFCKDKNRCLVCFRKLKKSGDVRIVEMTPRFINNTYMFLVRVLPYASDISYPCLLESNTTFTDNEEAAMGELVDALTIDYNVFNFNDPVDGKREAYIKSQLLQESELQKFNSGLPSDEDIDKKIVSQIAKLREMNLVDEFVRAPPKREYKYKAGPKSKKTKKE